MPTIYVRASRAKIAQTVRDMVGNMAGTRTGMVTAVQTMQKAIGMEVLGIIKEAFLAKAAGGTDEAGYSWQALSPKTIAYRRRFPELQRRRRYAKKQGRMLRPLLTAAEDKRWRSIFYGRIQGCMRQGFDEKEAKAHAAAIAWIALKADGAKTILSVYGGMKVEILRDTGILLNSLSPGVNSPEQIFKVEPGSVIVGTNRAGAAAHHAGSQRRNLPQRRLWPEVSSWPSHWWKKILEATRDAAVSILTKKLGE